MSLPSLPFVRSLFGISQLAAFVFYIGGLPELGSYIFKGSVLATGVALGAIWVKNR